VALFLSTSELPGGQLALADATVTLRQAAGYQDTGWSIATGDFTGDGTTDLLLGSTSGTAWLVPGTNGSGSLDRP